jgi:hypothetical protein
LHGPGLALPVNLPHRECISLALSRAFSLLALRRERKKEREERERLWERLHNDKRVYLFTFEPCSHNPEGFRGHPRTHGNVHPKRVLFDGIVNVLPEPTRELDQSWFGAFLNLVFQPPGCRSCPWRWMPRRTRCQYWHCLQQMISNYYLCPARVDHRQRHGEATSRDSPCQAISPPTPLLTSATQ